MSRPLRIEFEGAVYHVTSRGDRREPIYRDDVDRRLQLDVIAQAMERFDAQVLAWCQMGNHYHFVLHTRRANLSRLMRHVNGVYTQAFNRRHGLTGHLFQGRFKAILVDRDSYLLALCRYVERNPVAAGLVAAAGDWAWSSFRAHVGLEPTPPWLDTDGLHAFLLGGPVGTAGVSRGRQRAVRLYTQLVAEPQEGDASFWQSALRRQVFLGDETCVLRMQAHAEPQRLRSRSIPRSRRSRPAAWTQIPRDCGGDRRQALLMAYRDGGMTMTALAREPGLSVSYISRLIAAAENGPPDA